MKVDLEKLSETAVKLSVHLPFDELGGALNRAYASIAKQVNIPGFRKGKVPQAVIDQRIGRGAVLEEAVNEAVPNAYETAARDHGLVPVGRPTIDITEIADGSHVAFTAEVEIRPDFELPKYEGVEVQVDAVAADEALIAEQIDALRSRFATLSPVERNAADGDLLLVDISGEIDGEEIADLKANALSYELGTDGMLPGFDEAVRGAAKDEARNFEFVPEGGEHAGRPINMTVTVRAVRERNLPELNDDFAQLASEFDTVDELRADMAERVARLKRLEQGYQAREKVQEAIVNAIEIPLPEGLIAAELEEHFQDGHGDDAHRAEFEANQRKSLKAQFIFDRIADKEELSVTEQELSAWLIRQAPNYNMNPQEFADALVRSGGVQMAVADVRRAKAVELALQSAVITDTNGQSINLSDLDADLAALGR